MERIIVTAIIAFIIGIGGGFVLDQEDTQQSMPVGMHSMSQSMDAMTTGLEGKTGDAFDRAFIEEMTVHHQGAVAMAELALKNAKRAEIKELAEEIIAAQAREVDLMRGWLAAWY